jgi:KaiC/GvpD/RAD55 family RecA-like ATPase
VPDRIWDDDPELRAEADTHRRHYRHTNGYGFRTRQLEVIPFEQMCPRLDGRPLVKGFLEQEQISLWVGESGCGKTFLVLDLSLHIAAKLDWFGRKVEQGVVVYVAAEAGRSIINRVAAFKDEFKLEDRIIPFAAVTSSVDLCHAGVGDVDRLIEEIKEVAQDCSVMLVVIDTVSRALAGGNENAPDDMGAFVKSMDRLRDELQCHVAAVHHFGKETSRGGRGHSLLQCGVDTVIEVDRSAATGIATAVITKQRDGPTCQQIAFQLREITLGTNQDGDPVTSCVVKPIAASTKAQAKPKLSAAQARALELLKEALARNGQIPPTNAYIPINTSCVSEPLWRDYCYEGMISDTDKLDSKRKAFNRAAEALLVKGYVRKWSDLVWIVT